VRAGNRISDFRFRRWEREQPVATASTNQPGFYMSARYAPGETNLSALQDAADSEFPVAHWNVFTQFQHVGDAAPTHRGRRMIQWLRAKAVGLIFRLFWKDNQR
jgi:hypothetical protein